jgi:hypothetical protein
LDIVAIASVAFLSALQLVARNGAFELVIIIIVKLLFALDSLLAARAFTRSWLARASVLGTRFATATAAAAAPPTRPAS